MGERPAHILLLRAERHDDVLGSQRLQVTTDGAQTAVEDAKGQVLGGQERTLVQRLVGHALSLPLAQSDRALGPLLGETVAMIFLARVEGQDHRHHLAFRQGLVSWLVGRYSGHGQLTGLNRLWLGEPGEVDVLDQTGESLGPLC